MEENQETTNQTRPVMERKQISIPLVGGILIIIVGVVVFAAALKLLIFNEPKVVETKPVNVNETAEIVVDTPQIQY